MSEKQVITIDGSYIEGGGQILRIATGLSAILKQPVTVNKIRANRKPSGLRPQHLLGVQLIARVCQAKLTSCVVGSTEITLEPGDINVGVYEGDTKTAGSICLLIQSLLPPLLFAKEKSGLTTSTVQLRGGTNVAFAPPIDYFTEVLPIYLNKFGINFDVELVTRGYYPAGGGQINLRIPTLATKSNKGDENNAVLTPVNITERGTLIQVRITVFVDGQLSPKNGHIMREGFMKLFKSHYPDVQVTHKLEKNDKGKAKGIGIFVVAETSTNCRFGATQVCQRDSVPEQLAKELFDELHRELQSGACCDDYMQDQLVIFAALAKGRSSVRVGPLSNHTKTAIYAVEQLTEAKFSFSDCPDVPGTVLLVCDGIGLTSGI